MKRLACMVSLAVLIASCTKSPVSRFNNLVLPGNSRSVINASGEFSFKLFRNELKEAGDSNFMISPLSIYLALSMVCNGANHSTLDSMIKALQMENLSLDDLNAYCKAMIEQLPNEDSKVALSIANSIWYKQDISPVPSFLNTMGSNFHADLTSLNFSDPASVSLINNWVKNKTKDKINKIIEALDPDDLMYLINAIYFKGSWKNKFDPRQTGKDYFYPTTGNPVSVDFMNQKITTPVGYADKFSVAELPYGTGKAFSMYIILPAQGISVEEVAAGLSQPAFDSLVSRMSASEINISIPKWESSFEMKDLEKQLSGLGMGIAFSGDADFSNMYTTEAQITKALHKTYIKVDEEGTEAAAVTAIGIGFTAGPMTFKADHPFIYVIAEKQSGAVLFTGLLKNPLSAP